MRARHLCTVRIPEARLLLVLLALGVLLTLLSDDVTVGGRTVDAFLRVDNLVPNVLLPASWLAILALGGTVVIVAGGIDLSVGQTFKLAALAACAATQGLPEDASALLVWSLALGAALGTGLCCGLVNGALVVLLRVHPFLVTLGTMSIARGLANVLVAEKSLPSLSRTLPAAFTEHGVAWKIASGDHSFLQPVPILVAAAALGLVALLLTRTVAGRQIYAIGGNEQAAYLAGVSVPRLKLGVFAFAGLLAGLAGLLSAGFYGAASTATGEGYELTVVAAAVVGGASLAGGRGTALGAVLGALVIKLIENGIDLVRRVDLGVFVLPVSKEYGQIVIGVAILVAVACDRLSLMALLRRLRRR